jgi:hypothetical protein
MPTRKNPSVMMGKRVHLRPPRRNDQKAFIAQARASRPLHRGWVQAPETPGAFAAYVARYGTTSALPRHAGFLVVRLVRCDDDTRDVARHARCDRRRRASGYGDGERRAACGP